VFTSICDEQKYYYMSGIRFLRESDFLCLSSVIVGNLWDDKTCLSSVVPGPQLKNIYYLFTREIAFS
jgi:hypothetical protein